nr:retrotransposon protein, putative, Ty1-copia subclass [Tanacetum cinerariifolium]
MLQDEKSYPGRCFTMKDLEEAAYILGIKIYRDRSKRSIGLCQSTYIKKILKRFYMGNSKREMIPMQEKLKFSKSQGASIPAEIQRMQSIPYALAAGSIMYAVRCTRPDVAFIQNITNTKRELMVSCYTDAGYLTDANGMKSQTRYVFVLNGGVVDWKSTKQSIFATSSTYAEYIAAFYASKEAVWISKVIYGLGVVSIIEELINMYRDNTRALEIVKDHRVTKGARHFRSKAHYLRETIKMGDMRIEKVDTDDNLSDLFTKALAFPKHSELTEKIEMISASRSIMYAVRCTRPDVAFAQNMTSRFQQNPGEEHWTAVKNILKYLRNTKDMFLVYGGNMEREVRVSCYTDAGYLTDADNLKSQTGYVFALNGGAVDWKSTKQSIFATSSTDAEYIAAFDASKEAVWIRKFISGLGIVPTIEEPINMYCDNTGAIAITKDDGITKGARHFHPKVHYLRETIKLGDNYLHSVREDLKEELKEEMKVELKEEMRVEIQDMLVQYGIKSRVDLDMFDYSLTIEIFVRDKMSRDVVTIGSTMRIPLLYRGEYSQWSERFMNYLEEKTDGETMIISIKHGEHPLPIVNQVSLARTASNTPPNLKDPKFWTAKEKKTQKIDHLARSLLIQGLLNDIYSLIDSNDTAKYLWDALERHMRGSEYGEHDRKAAILYEYETFRTTEGEQLLDTYLHYLQVINDLKKCGYKKDNCDVNDAIGYKKKAVVVTLYPLALVADKTKVSKRREKIVVQSESEGSDDDDISDLKKITTLLAKSFNQKKYYAKPTNNNLRTSSASSSANKKLDYYKTKMLLAKKDSDRQVLLSEDQAWIDSSSDSDQEINANMVFMAKIEKVLSDSEESSSSAE